MSRIVTYRHVLSRMVTEKAKVIMVIAFAKHGDGGWWRRSQWRYGWCRSNPATGRSLFKFLLPRNNCSASGALLFNSWVFKTSCGTAISRAPLEYVPCTLNPGFVAFVWAAATSQSVFEFGVFLRKQILQKGFPLFTSGGGLSTQALTSHLPLGAPLLSPSPTPIICSHVDVVMSQLWPPSLYNFT